MKHTFRFNRPFLGTVLILLAGCSDPADKVPKSSATTPQEEPAATVAPAAVAGSAAGRTYSVRPGSTIRFVGSTVTGSHNGGFTNFSGTLMAADGKITGHPEITIDMKSTWADNPKLTGHLMSPDFFNVAQFPTSKFIVTAVDPAGKVTGNLTLHGVTKTLSFPATVQVMDDAVTVKAQFAINRKDFNITYPGKPDDLIRDNVVIKFDLRATP